MAPSHDEILRAQQNQQKRNNRPQQRTATVVAVQGNTAMVRLGGSGNLTPVQVDPSNLPYPGDVVSVNRPADTASWSVSNVQQSQQPSRSIYPRRAILFVDSVAWIQGGPGLIGLDSTQQYGYFVSTTTPSVDGNSFAADFVLAAGTYTLSNLGRTSAGLGLLDIYLDDVLVTSGQDWYSASTVLNVIKSATLTVAQDGLHTLTVTVNGRNASATNYNMSLTALRIYLP